MLSNVTTNVITKAFSFQRLNILFNYIIVIEKYIIIDKLFDRLYYNHYF